MTKPDLTYLSYEEGDKPAKVRLVIYRDVRDVSGDNIPLPKFPSHPWDVLKRFTWEVRHIVKTDF